MADGSSRVFRNPTTVRRRLPVILQTEAAECGLACLAMIANAHGHELDLPALRRRFSTSLRGTTLARMIDEAHELGFDTRPLRVELEHLPELSVPCILHWNLNHFVVLKRANGRGVEIHDPASGARKLRWAEASCNFTGIALELQPSVHFRTIKDAQVVSLRAITGPLHGVGSSLVQVLMLAFGLELLTLAIPFYTQLVLDQALLTADTNLLAVLGISFLFVVAFQAGMTAARGWAISWISGKLTAEWTTNLFHHLLRLPLSFFEKRHAGDIASRFSSVQSVRATLSSSFVETVLNGVMGPLTMAMLIAYNAHLTTLVFFTCTIYAWLRWYSSRLLWKASEEQLTYASRQTTLLFESIRGAQTIKLANKESMRSARFAYLALNTMQREIIVQRVGFAFTALSRGLFGAQRVAVVWLGSMAVLRGTLSAGMLVAFLAYADQLTTCFGGLIDRLVDFRMLRLHAGRIADITLTPPEQNVTSRHGVLIAAPEIEIKNVSFRYSDNEPWILRHCNFKIPAGESVAITGPSGCGKTTLVKLILGLLEPTEGIVRIDGVDIRQFGLKAYRDLVGAVMQDDQLFEGSIADNISFFDHEATPENVEAAARLAAIHDDIAAMPMGYDTLVGDMGSSLSGGQKQRTLLARALYRKPTFIVLDEATSHLDLDRERTVNQSIKGINATQLIIAHRPETVALATKIISPWVDGTSGLSRRTSE